MPELDPNKLQELEDKIDAFRAKKAEPTEPSEDQENLRVGLRAGTELVSAIAAGGLIGYFLDEKFDTKPLFLLVLLILGVITGFMNVWRVSQGMGTSVGIGKSQAELDKTKENNRE
jgi:ATP synthase protein I